MEIQISSPTQAQPLPLVQWNYGEVKQYVQDGLARYKGVIYDDTQIALAKTDRASLNKLAAAIDAKRKEMKALYLQPYTEFEAQAKELTAMVKLQVDEIDAQVKAFENHRKEEKLAFIKEQIYAPIVGNLAELIPYDKIHNPKWLNVTTNANAISEEIARTVENVENGLNAINQLGLAPDVAEQVRRVFMRTFDLAAAIAEKERILAEREKLERYRAAQQAQVAEAPPQPISTPVEEETPTQPEQRPTVEEKTYSVTFRINATKAQLDALGAFMKTINIKPERV